MEKRFGAGPESAGLGQIVSQRGGRRPPRLAVCACVTFLAIGAVAPDALMVRVLAAATSGGVYTAVTPTRLLDTRNFAPFLAEHNADVPFCFNDPNPGCTDLGPGQSLDLQVVGRARM